MKALKLEQPSSNVDQYTGDLFSNYTGVATDLCFDGLVELAEDFIETVSRHFDGIDCNHSAEEYANWYLENNKMDWE